MLFDTPGAGRARRRDLRQCRCGAAFDLNRDVSRWPFIDDENASEYCKVCWFKMARTRGRPMGQPHARPGLTDQQLQDMSQ